MAMAVAVVVVLIGGWMAYHARSTLTRADPQFTELQKCFREIEPLFPHQLQAIVFDDRGAELVLADAATVPASMPLYIKVCGPNGCRRFVTFSGQQIRVNGDLCDVLLDRQGNILVVGQQLAWSSSNPAGKAGTYQIEARPLGTT